MQIVLFECSKSRKALLPLTYTCAVPDFRLGILRLRDKWALRTKQTVAVLCAEDYLQPAYACELGTDNYFVHGHLCCNDELFDAVSSLSHGEGLFYKDQVLAARLPALPQKAVEQTFSSSLIESVKTRRVLQHAPRLLCNLLVALDWNSEEIVADMHLLGAIRANAPAYRKYLRIYGDQPVFISPTASFNELICNSEKGPIYIGENVTIGEGTCIHGPCAIGDNARINMGTKLCENCSIGPHCSVGGEISKSILFSYSNKQHDGFLGHSIIGNWCNLGAGTSCSNLKNNYGKVSLWDYEKAAYISTNKQFCGLFMGDYAKSAINQSFNTGTVIGPFANVFGAGFPERQIPAFSWGSAEKTQTYRFEEAIKAANRMMARRSKAVSDVQLRIFSHIFDVTQTLRK